MRSSVFPRGAALCARLFRKIGYSDGGLAFAEPIPDRIAPRIPAAARKRVQCVDRDAFARRHCDLVGLATAVHRCLVVYTDGSAQENPGRCGFGVVIIEDGIAHTTHRPVGLGTSVTAELCALRFALRSVVGRVREFDLVLIFSDCQVAIDLIEGAYEPTGHHAIVRECQDLLREARADGNVDLHWVPGHAGIDGNELADAEATAGVDEVTGDVPRPGQPPIPLSISVSLLRRALRQEWQYRWTNTYRAKLGAQHLSRIKPSLDQSPAFFVGSRSQQTTLARLRAGVRALDRDWFSEWPPSCTCGLESETVDHFLLRCPQYARERVAMLDAVGAVYAAAPITEQVLLGGQDVRLSADDWTAVVSAVAAFARAARRGL